MVPDLLLHRQIHNFLLARDPGSGDIAVPSGTSTSACRMVVRFDSRYRFSCSRC
jgi:hypothetical protein